MRENRRMRPLFEKSSHIWMIGWGGGGGLTLAHTIPFVPPNIQSDF